MWKADFTQTVVVTDTNFYDSFVKKNGWVSSSHSMTQSVGYYTRPICMPTNNVDGSSLIPLVILAAMETTVRFSRNLSIGVRDQRRKLSNHLATMAETSDILYKIQCPDRTLLQHAAHDAISLLALKQHDEGLFNGLTITLIDEPFQMNAKCIDPYLLCCFDNNLLCVIAACDINDPWARACNAVAEVFAETLHELQTDPQVTPAAARGIGAASLKAVLGPLSGCAHENGIFKPIPLMLEHSVDRQPDRIAYQFVDRSLTYEMFDKLANGFSKVLATRGVQRGAVIPVLLNNSLEMPVAYYALMKLGAAYVPLDEAWPEDRLKYVLHMLNSGTVVCTKEQAIPIELRHTALHINVDTLTPITQRPNIRLSPEDAIYGFFTSGTTGYPKCAMNNHRGLSNRFCFMSRYFHNGHSSRCVLQNSKHTFDSSIWQLFWPLTNGGQVVIPQQGAFLELDATIDIIESYGITMTDFVPSVFNRVVALAERSDKVREKLFTLRELIIGGEEITAQMVHKMRAILPNLRVTNAYGPTETSIGMIFHQVEIKDGTHIPLGRPIDNCYVLFVDYALRPLPPGACGELLIGGACVGNGYLHDVDKTTQAFIDNPFPSIPSARLYRTGDLGYFDSIGRIVFAGRNDFQIKIGGVRIEFGEVESAAERCLYVHQAKALVNSSGSENSIALFVTGDVHLEHTILEHHLHQLLPRHSLPRQIFILPKMPLTDNGKIDRRQLETMLKETLISQTNIAPSNWHLLPRAFLLKHVLEVFRKSMARLTLEESDNVFNAGIDSLQALATVMELQRVYGLPFSVRDLIEHPSPTEICIHMTNLQSKEYTIESEDLLMENDVRLSLDLVMSTIAPHTPFLSAEAPKRLIFLTGATGFVGSNIVHELLKRTDVQVYALCRFNVNPQTQLIDVLVRKGLWDQRFTDRLHAIRGDLMYPRLGLDEACWAYLAEHCDGIVHCGAMINFLYDYDTHRAVNVLGTLEVLKLSLESRVKPLYYISTLSTLEKEARLHSEPLRERIDLDQTICPSIGYSRSKWIAERMLLKACAYGASITIFRLGEVMPSTNQPFPNTRALTHLLLSAFIQLNAIPDIGIRSDWSPVDYVACRVTAAIFDPSSSNCIYHVFHPDSIDFTQVLQCAGITLNKLPCDKWLAHLERKIAENVSHELNVLRYLLLLNTADATTLSCAFSRALTDNPRLFSRVACSKLEDERKLDDCNLFTSIISYGQSLVQVETVK